MTLSSICSTLSFSGLNLSTSSRLLSSCSSLTIVSYRGGSEDKDGDGGLMEIEEDELEGEGRDMALELFSLVEVDPSTGLLT